MTAGVDRRHGYRRNGLSDWRNGALAYKSPRSFQARVDGPPLLFLTDVRMSVLVTLAMSPTPYRIRRLEEHLGKANLSPCIRDLVASGILTSWEAGRSHRLVALDPCHPCYESMVPLLRRIGDLYGFPKPLYLSENLFAGAAPMRTSRSRDARLIFGRADRTLALLAVFLLRRASINDVTRSLRFFDRLVLSRTLWRFEHFEVLRADVVGGSAGVFFELNPDCEFAAELRSVLEQVAKRLTVWIHLIEDHRTVGRTRAEQRPKSRPVCSDVAFRQWSNADRLRRKLKKQKSRR